MKKESKDKIKKEIIIWISAIVGSFLVLMAVFMVTFGWEFVGPFLKDTFTAKEKKQEQDVSSNGKTSLKDMDIKLSSKTLQISKINILSAEENPDNIWEIAWPDEYQSGGTSINFGSECKEISKEDRDFLLTYCNTHEDTYDGDFLCSISISTIDDKHHSGQHLYVCGEYPEDFEEFVIVINRVCGGDKEYLSANKKIKEITPEYVTEITGITDDDVNGGTVSELIDHLGISDISTLSIYLKNSYINKIASKYKLCRLLEYKIISVQSTDDEWLEYSQKLAEKLGVNGEIIKGKAPYEDQEWYEIKDSNGTEIRIYRTYGLGSFISQYPGMLDSYYQSYKIYEDTQGPTSEFMGYRDFDFTYSNDNKFAVAVESDYSKEKETFYNIALAAKEIE